MYGTYILSAGHNEIETRNGSGQVLTQYVWDSLAPGRYIDSLAQVAHNLQPGLDDDTATAGTQDLVDTRLYPMQDSTFNVLGLATAAGDLAERYDYDAYGQRRVYTVAGRDFAAFAWADAVPGNDNDNGGDLASWRETG